MRYPDLGSCGSALVFDEDQVEHHAVTQVEVVLLVIGRAVIQLERTHYVLANARVAVVVGVPNVGEVVISVVLESDFHPYGLVLFLRKRQIPEAVVMRRIVNLLGCEEPN